MSTPYYVEVWIDAPTPEDMPSPEQLIEQIENLAVRLYDLADLSNDPEWEISDVYVTGVGSGCDHQWASMVNEVITSGEMCLKCNRIRP